jgi:hypothetical protein
MGRHSKFIGTWIKLWTKQLLQDPKLKELPDEYTCWFIRVLCAADMCMNDGKFLVGDGVKLTPEQIAEMAHITVGKFEKVQKEGFVVLKDGVYTVKAWEKWQKGYRQ